ncbi:MAG: hypothetical protein ACFFEJ_19435 [Candidatus Thorarchaeota archaeon]
MQAKESPVEQKSSRIAPKNVGYTLALLSFILPSELSMMQRSNLSLSITNYIWYLRLEPYINFKVYSIETMAWGVVIFTLSMRLLFAFQVMRLYEGKTTGRTVYFSSLPAISVEMTSFLVNITALFWNPESPYLFSSIPLPFLLLIAILIIIVFSPGEANKSWIEREPDAKWWGPQISVGSSTASNSKSVEILNDS